MKYTNKNNLPSNIVNACLEDDGHELQLGVYHATELLQPVKITILKRRYDAELELDVSDSLNLLFGKAVHTVLESGNKSKFQQAEKFISRDIDIDGEHLKVVGRMDLWQPNHRCIVDWKTATVTKVLKQDYEDYKKQGLIYAWILQGNGITASTLKFEMMLKDWSKAKLRLETLRGNPYPAMMFHEWKYTITEKDMEEIDTWIHQRLKQILEYEKLADDEIPECNEEERWADPTKYAVMRYGRKTAIKLCDSIEEADALIASGGDDCYLEIRQSVSRRCCDYCIVNKYCKFYKEENKEWD